MRAIRSVLSGLLTVVGVLGLLAAVAAFVTDTGLSVVGERALAGAVALIIAALLKPGPPKQEKKAMPSMAEQKPMGFQEAINGRPCNEDWLITYANPDDNFGRRTISNIHISADENEVEAYCSRRGIRKTFQLDKIINIENETTGETIQHNIPQWIRKKLLVDNF